jgi:DNA polymerase-3 subunit beta
LETVEFADDDSTIYVRLGHRQFTSRKLLTGQFPNYEAVVPLQNNLVLHVRPTDFEAGIRRVATFADEQSQAITFTFADNAVKISSSSSESGQSEETLETSYAGGEVVVKLNSDYVLDFIKAAGPTGEIQIRLKDGGSSVLMQPEGGDTAADGFQLSYTVMPCR